MRRPKTLIHPPLLLPIFLLLVSSHVSGLEATREGESSFVVFSSFPSFSPEGDGTQGSTSHAVPVAAKRESGHDGSSASLHGVPLSISEVEGLGNDRDITTSQNDTPKTGIFLFTTLMKDKQHQTTSDAEDSATTVAADDSTTISDMTVILTEPTAAPVIIQAESAPLTPSSPIVAESPEGPREKESNVDKVNDRSSQSQPDEPAQPELPISGGSLAARLQGLRPNPRHTTRAVQEREEKEENFSQQMTLAERLKALQAKRAQRFGSLARRDRGPLRRRNLTPKNTEDAVQRRLGELAAARASEGETRQEAFPVSIEPKDTFISPLPEKGNEGEHRATETHDLVGEETTLSHTTPEQVKSTVSPATSTPSPSNIKKPERKSYAQRLRERLQKRRERNRNATIERLRNSRPNSTARPQTPPRPEPEDNTQSGSPSRNNNPRLNASQRRRQELLKRLKHRSSTPRPAGPLSLREKINQLRNRNRFIPTSIPKQTTTTTTSRTTGTPTTTPITTPQPPTTIRTTPALVFTTWPVTQESATTTPVTAHTTPQPVTTIRTTPSLAFTTWPATQESDDDNFLVTVPSTTEADEDSRRFQIRQMIDAMLSSKGLSGTTTTEQVLSFLEEATSKPIFMEATKSPRITPTEHSSRLRPTFSFAASDGKEGRPSTTRARDRPSLFQHFPSLADKLAGSHSPKKSKFHPTPPAARDTPPTSTHEDKSSANNRRIISLSELLAGGNNVRAAADLPHRIDEETNTDSTTITSEVETTSLSADMTTVGMEMDILPTTQPSMERTTTEDQRVKDLISKLLAQGVITMPAPGDSDTVTSGMEDDQSTTAVPDTSFVLEDTQAPPRESTKNFVLDPHISTEADKSQTQSSFMPPLHSEEPQLTRGAPQRRPSIISTFSSTDSPLVPSVGVTDTTVKLSTDVTEITEIPPITTTSDTLLQTSPPHIQEESTLPDTRDLGENEIDVVNSKDNLQSLMRGFVLPSIRPELAAVNHVLGFSLTTDDVVDLVEVNIEKPQVSEDEDTLYDDMETAATEQVMITTSFFQNEDLTPTPLNLDVTSLSVSESSPQIHSTTEATGLSREAATVPTVTGTQPPGDEMTMFTEESSPSVDLEFGTTELIPITTTSHQIITESSAIHTSSTPDAMVPLTNEEPSTVKESSPSSVSDGNQDTLIPKPEQPESDNVTASLQKLLRQGAFDKAEALLSDSISDFQGVSEAVMRERLHLLKLVKERQDSKSNHETPHDQVQPTLQSPTITSRVSLSELLRKKTSGEITESEVTLKPSLSSLQPREETKVATEAHEPHSVVSTMVAEQTNTQKDTSNRPKTSDAMRRFLELNKHVLQTLRARKKAISSTLPTTTSTTPATLQTIPDLISGLTVSDSQRNSPVISEVTPQSQVITSVIPEETGQPLEGAKERPSLLLRPVLLRPQKSEISTQEKSRSHVSSTVNPLSASVDNISHPPVPTVRSRIPPPFRQRRPHPPTKFSITRQQQQAGSPLPTKPSEGAVESPKVKVHINTRPLLRPASSPNTSDASITTGMIKTDNPSKDEDLDVGRTTSGFRSAEVQTERPDDDSFTTLASLLKRKQTSSTKFHPEKQKTTSLPKTTTDSTPEVTTQTDNETLPPVTPPEQEEATTPQLFDEDQPIPAPQDDPDNSLRPASVRGTFLATEGMTAEHVPPPFNFLDRNTSFQTRAHGTFNGGLSHGVTSFDVSPGVPLPLPATSAPKAVFPITAPAIKFEPTPIPARFPTREEAHDLDASTTTDSPSSFSTIPLDFKIQTDTPSPPKLTFDMDRSTSPLGFNFQLHRKPSATDEGILTTGSDTHQSRPLQALFSTTTPGTGFGTFTLGQNEAFFTDDKTKETPIIIPVTEIPLVTTPITSATPRVILLTLPVANGSVTADSLLPETTSFQESTETSVPSTTTITSTTTTSNRKKLQPQESLAPPPNIMHMITKGVTITSTEGVIERVLSHHESVPQPPPHSLTFLPPTSPTVLHADHNPPESVFQTEDEKLSIRILSESLPENTKEKNLQGEGTLRQQQHRVLDTTRPNLQGGHLNLNELRQRQLGGKGTAEGSQGPHASSGLQEQQTDSQAILGQTNVPRQQIFQAGQVVTGQHIFHNLQNSPREQKIVSGQHNIDQHIVEEGHVKSSQEGQIISDVQVPQRQKEGQADQHTVDNQHIHTQGQVLPDQKGVHQHAIEQRKGPADGHNPTHHHSLKQAQGGSLQFDALNQHTTVQSEARLGEHKTTTQHQSADGQLTAHQHKTVQGQGVLLKQVTEVQSVHNRSEQEQGKPSQHAEQPEKQHLDQNLQDQQDSQGQHNVQGQNIQGQHNLQGEVIQAQGNPQGHIITNQDNSQDQHNQQHQHMPQGHITQDQHNFQGDLIHGQHNQQGQHNIQGKIIQDQHNQDQHNFQGDLIHGQHNQQGQHNIQGKIIQDQHNQDQHNIQGQISQDQHNQNQHTTQNKITEDQHNQDQHNIQGKIIQLQHNQDSADNQNQHKQHQHNIQGQIIRDQHNQDQHNIQGQIIQAEHIQGQHKQDQHNQGQQNIERQIIQVQHNQGQHNTQEQRAQGQHKQDQHKEDHHNIQGQIIRVDHDQDQHNTQGQVIQGQHNQDQHNIQGQIIQDQQSTQGQVIHDRQNSQGHHNLQRQTSQDQHHQQDQPNGQTQTTQGQRNLQEEVIHDHHQPQVKSTQPQHTPEEKTPSTQVRQEQPPSQPQRKQPQRGEHTAEGHRHLQGQRAQGQGKVSRGQATPKQPTQTGQQIFRGRQTSTVSQKQHQRQHDGRQQAAEGTQRQPQPNSRRGKFISGDAVQGVQQGVVVKQSSRSRVTVQDSRGSGRTIIRGQSVVPPVKALQTPDTRFRPQQQKVQAETRRGLAAEGRPQGHPRATPAHQGSIGHFNNLAAGFIRGPANSFITRFPSQEAEVTTGDNDGDFPVTILPEASKVPATPSLPVNSSLTPGGGQPSAAPPATNPPLQHAADLSPLNPESHHVIRLHDSERHSSSSPSSSSSPTNSNTLTASQITPLPVTLTPHTLNTQDTPGDTFTLESPTEASLPPVSDPTTSLPPLPIDPHTPSVEPFTPHFQTRPDASPPILFPHLPRHDQPPPPPSQPEGNLITISSPAVNTVSTNVSLRPGVITTTTFFSDSPNTNSSTSSSLPTTFHTTNSPSQTTFATSHPKSPPTTFETFSLISDKSSDSLSSTVIQSVPHSPVLTQSTPIPRTFTQSTPTSSPPFSDQNSIIGLVPPGPRISNQPVFISENNSHRGFTPPNNGFSLTNTRLSVPPTTFHPAFSESPVPNVIGISSVLSPPPLSRPSTISSQNPGPEDINPIILDSDPPRVLPPVTQFPTSHPPVTDPFINDDFNTPTSFSITPTTSHPSTNPPVTFIPIFDSPGSGFSSFSPPVTSFSSVNGDTNPPDRGFLSSFDFDSPNAIIPIFSPPVTPAPLLNPPQSNFTIPDSLQHSLPASFPQPPQQRPFTFPSTTTQPTTASPAFPTSSPPLLHITSTPPGLFHSPFPSSFPPAVLQSDGSLHISPQHHTPQSPVIITTSNPPSFPATLSPRPQERLSTTPSALDFGIPNTPVNQQGNIQLFDDPPLSLSSQFRFPFGSTRSPDPQRLIPTPVPTNPPASPPSSTLQSFSDQKGTSQPLLSFPIIPQSQFVSTPSSFSPFPDTSSVLTSSSLPFSPADDGSVIISGSRDPSSQSFARFQSPSSLGSPLIDGFTPSTPSSFPLLVFPPSSIAPASFSFSSPSLSTTQSPISSSSFSIPESNVSSSPSLASLLLPNSKPLFSVTSASSSPSPLSSRNNPRSSFLLPNTPSPLLTTTPFPSSTPSTFIPFTTSPSSFLIPNTPITSSPPNTFPSLPPFTSPQTTTDFPSLFPNTLFTSPISTFSSTPSTFPPRQTSTDVPTTTPASTPRSPTPRTRTNKPKRVTKRRRNRGKKRFPTTSTPITITTTPTTTTLSPNPDHDVLTLSSTTAIPSTTRGPSLPSLDGGAEREARRRLPLSQDPDGDEIPGQAGIDYPIRTNIPVTSFICSSAMANRMFADPDTSCQVYHVCSGDHKFSFLCPKGTLFNQDTSVCQWWFTVDCDRQARRLAEVRALG